MSKVKILFVAADPLSAPPQGHQPRLLLDDDVREIQQKVRAAEYRDVLQFDFRMAARGDDLLQALYETRPEVVHFSGHGGKQGLVFVGSDGVGAHRVDAEALGQVFQVFRGNIRVVVLNACFSLPQARAIAEAMGCAIGMRREISDAAAITFAASFYRAVAFGESVQAAYDQACAALALEHFEERECPQLVARADVDPAQIKLLPPALDVTVGGGPTGAVGRRRRSLVGAVTLRTKRVVVAAAVAFASLVAALSRIDGDPACGWDADGTPHLLSGGSPAWAVPFTSADASGSGTDLEVAKAFHRARNDRQAFPHFERAAQAGNLEATGFLGVAYLCGEGTARRTTLGISWLRDAATKRDPRAMTALAFAYRNGVGVHPSPRWTRYWYQIAAERNWPEAMRSLGALYLEKSKPDSALLWYGRAVRAGSPEAMVDLGGIYETGRAGPRDPREARRLYEMAATAGSARGMFSMGRIYRESVGVPRDYGRAMEWYQKAMAAGSVEAMNGIGLLYQNGWGVSADRTQAIYWFRRAKAAGSTIAAGNLVILGVN